MGDGDGVVPTLKIVCVIQISNFEMGSSVDWKTYINNQERRVRTPILVDVENHPLKLSHITVRDRITRRVLGSQPSTGQTSPISTPNSALQPLTLALEGLDPLTQFSLQEKDPLSQMLNEKSVEMESSNNSTNVYRWNVWKNSILAKFTTSEKLSIVTSFLPDVAIKVQTSAVDKVQHRLEQLDNFEDGSQRKLHLSQTEYMSRIQQLNKELVSAWHNEQRVKALKIAIQCAKLLSDTDVLWFYPSKFVLITDILDVFGQLVYDRLRTKADYVRPGGQKSTALPADFSPDMVPELAKETCRNWFFKIASIRELVPRLYVEMALLKSYKFLNSSDPISALSRLPQMINGIGNPLVAVYARCYLCRVGQQVFSPLDQSTYLMQNFTNFLDCYNHLFSQSVKQELNIQDMEISTYMTLFSPALDFMLHSLANSGSESLLLDLLNKSGKYGYSSLIVNSIMAAFKPSYIAFYAVKFLQMFQESQKHDLPRYLLLRTLGLSVNAFQPPQDQRREVLGLAWNYIATLTSPEQYISCAEIWMKYTVKCFCIREINAVLGDVIEHMNVNRAYEHHYSQLRAVVDTIVFHLQDLESILSIENLLPFIDLFQQETTKVEVCKLILKSCSSEHRASDPVITNALIFLCTVLHDSVTALTVEDEVRQIGEILCTIIRCVDFGRDFEKQLNFYVEARATFFNIDAVLVQLIQSVNVLAVNTRQIVKGHHTNKTADFVRACVAYCFITIPCLCSARTRLELYLLTGRVALFNQCLGQADACFEAALNIIEEFNHDINYSSKEVKELYLVSYARSFLSSLLVVPDNPNLGVLRLTKKLLKALQKYNWNDRSGNFILLYIESLDLLSVMAQENYPYHINKIESNDALYGSDPKFITEINKMCSVIVEEILSQLKQLGPGSKQSELVLELLTRVALRSDLNHVAMQNLFSNLWQLAIRYGHADIKCLTSTKEFLAKEAMEKNKLELKQLVGTIKIP